MEGFFYWRKEKYYIVSDEDTKSNCALMAADATTLIFTLLGHVVF